MEHIFVIASVWLGLAVISAIIAYHLRISIALVEICVGVAAGGMAGLFAKPEALGMNIEWLRFLASSGAILLTFLAGAELEPDALRTKVKEVSVVGLVGFLAPFLGCAAVARYCLGWDYQASLLCGVALSTTSMAVVYAVMLETGLNKTEFGKGILGACFINDLGTVIALGLLFAPFTYKTLVFVAVSGVVLAFLSFRNQPDDAHLCLPHGRHTGRNGCMLVLFGLGALALWAGSEGVLPAYIGGMVLAPRAGKDDLWIRRMRTLTIGFLTPFYFLRAGMLVSIGALVSAPLVFLALLAAKVLLQNLRPLPCDPAVQAGPQRALVLHPSHVHGIDVRDDLGALRARPRYRDAGTILFSRCNGYSERRGADPYRHDLFPAGAPSRYRAGKAATERRRTGGRGINSRPSFCLGGYRPVRRYRDHAYLTRRSSFTPLCAFQCSYS